MDNSTTIQVPVEVDAPPKQTPYQAKDGALKVMTHYFAKVLLPYWKIPGEVDYIAPTESVHLELRK